MGSKMKVDLGPGFGVATQVNEMVPFRWKGKALGQFPWNSTAIQTGMTVEEVEYRQLSFFKIPFSFHLKATLRAQ